MTNLELIAHLKRLVRKTQDNEAFYGVRSEISEFLRTYVGPKNAYLQDIKRTEPFSRPHAADIVKSNLQALIASVQAGVHQGVSPERQAQLDVVSDFLEMGQRLLEAKDVHPAGPAVLIGATLEEFLRTWVEAEGLPLGNRKPSLETYSQVLRDADLISKQDGKDITSWAGLRNHAAHGEWSEVSEPLHVKNMLEGVNLFMLKYDRRGSA